MAARVMVIAYDPARSVELADTLRSLGYDVVISQESALTSHGAWEGAPAYG